TALRDPDQRSPLRPNRVHHGPQVVHAHLEGGHINGPVAQPRADLVKGDDAGKAPHTFEPRGRSRPALRVQSQVEVRHEPWDEHDVDRTVADHRVRDVHVTSARVPNLGPHAHILTHREEPQENPRTRPHTTRARLYKPTSRRTPPCNV